jgi:hypothetical protein
MPDGWWLSAVANYEGFSVYMNRSYILKFVVPALVGALVVFLCLYGHMIAKETNYPNTTVQWVPPTQWGFYEEYADGITDRGYSFSDHEYIVGFVSFSHTTWRRR